MKRVCICTGSRLLADGLHQLFVNTGRWDVSLLDPAARLPAAGFPQDVALVIVDVDSFAALSDTLSRVLGLREKFSRTAYPEEGGSIIVGLLREPSETCLRHAALLDIRHYIFKTQSFPDVLRAIESSVEGKPRLPAAAAESLRKLAREEFRGTLTPREREVLHLIGEGFTSKEIAYALAISVSTVETYRRRLFRKTDSVSIAGLIRFAIKIGLCSV